MMTRVCVAGHVWTFSGIEPYNSTVLRDSGEVENFSTMERPKLVGLKGTLTVNYALFFCAIMKSPIKIVIVISGSACFAELPFAVITQSEHSTNHGCFAMW